MKIIYTTVAALLLFSIKASASDNNIISWDCGANGCQTTEIVETYPDNKRCINTGQRWIVQEVAGQTGWGYIGGDPADMHWEVNFWRDTDEDCGPDYPDYTVTIGGVTFTPRDVKDVWSGHHSYGDSPNAWVTLKNGTSIKIKGITVEDLAEKIGFKRF